MTRTIVKNFEEFEGLDLTSSDLSRNENFATLFNNWEHVGLKSIRSRKGFKRFAFHERAGSGTFDAQAHGLASYKFISQSDASVRLQENLLLFYNTKSVLFESIGQVVMDYTGAGTGTLSILFDTVSFVHKAYLKVNGVVTQSFSVENITVSTFVSTVDAFTDWACVLDTPTTFPTLGASTTEPLAIDAFPLIENEPIGTSTKVYFSYMKVRNALLDKFPSGTNFNNYTFTSGYGQPISWVNKNNVLYLAYGRRLTKWDGMNLYDASLPACSFALATSVGAGLGDGVYRYVARFHHVDFQNNDIYGDYYSATITTGGGSNRVLISVDPTTIYDLGWNTKFARVNGAQVAVTVITVDAGHTFEIGDPAYFLDGSTGITTSRYISATTATTITISGSAVNVADNAPISCNLRVEIARTTANGVDLYVNDMNIGEMVYDESAMSRTDTISDVSLITNELFEAPELPISSDTDATTLCVHQGKLFAVAGIAPYPATAPSIDVYYEFDDNFLEAFSELASVRVPATTNSPITCIHSDNDSMLAVFKEDCYYNVVGEVGLDGNYEVVVKSEEDIGCPSPHSIKKINAIKGSLFCSNRGFAILSSGEIDETIGERTRIAFQDINYDRGQGYANEELDIPEFGETAIIPYKAVAVNHSIDGKYICMVPAYSGEWGVQVTLNYYRCFVFDYRYNKWSEWVMEQARPNGGMVMYKGKLHTLEVGTSYGYPGTNSTCQIWKELKNEVILRPDGEEESPLYDYIDGVTPISNYFQTTGLHLGDPSILKLYLICKIYQLQISRAAFTLNLTTYRNFNSGEYGVAHSNVDYSISTTDLEKSKDLKRTASRVLAFVFANYEYHQCPMMSGYEIEMDQDYLKEGISRK